MNQQLSFTDSIVPILFGMTIAAIMLIGIIILAMIIAKKMKIGEKNDLFSLFMSENNKGK